MHKVTSRGQIKEDNRPQDSNGRKGSDFPDNSISMGNSMDDWRRAISTPTRYRVGSASFSLRPRDILQILAATLVVLVIVILIYSSRQSSTGYNILPAGKELHYNSKYPLTDPTLISNGKKFRIAVITDLDHGSKVKDSLWKSNYLKGYLTVYDDMKFNVEFESQSIDLHSSLGQGGRGMELSELTVFDGNVITVDDRTGVVYKLLGEEVVPWVILSDGPGDVSKGFKSEWATVKDGHLYVGGLGKEWTTVTGEVVNLNPQYVKRIGPDGSVEHLDWHRFYDAMRNSAGFPAPGYMIHESGVWSNVHKRWFFLPRRASTEKYDEVLDERRATNVLLICDENFTDIKVVQPFGPPSLTHGFSSFKFIPGTNDEYMIALKSEEDNGKTASYIMVLDLKGNMLMKEMQLIGSHKYEGVEFI